MDTLRGVLELDGVHIWHSVDNYPPLISQYIMVDWDNNIISFKMKTEKEDWGCDPKDLVNVADALAQDDVITAKEVISTAQAVLTALNVGDVKSESALHQHLRGVLIKYREDNFHE